MKTNLCLNFRTYEQSNNKAKKDKFKTNFRREEGGERERER